MKRIFLILCLLPFAASASTKLSDCDNKPYQVKITNSGQTRMATLSPGGGIVEEFGPNVTFQLEGQPPVTTHEQLNEYCIWHGKIIIQRRDPGRDSGGFGGLGGFR